MIIFLCGIFSYLSAAEKVAFVYEVYPPYEYYENGELTGRDYDIIKEICRRTGIEPEFRERPWKRAIQEVKDGTSDAIFSLVKTDERETFLYYPSEPLSYESYIFLARKGSGIKINSLDDLKGKTVGVCCDYSYFDEFDNHKGFTREYTKDDSHQLLKLAGGRMDVVIINHQVYIFTVKGLGKGYADKFEKIDYKKAPDIPMYVAFSKALGKKTEVLNRQFSQEIRKMKNDGSYLRILKKYK